MNALLGIVLQTAASSNSSISKSGIMLGTVFFLTIIIAVILIFGFWGPWRRP